MGNGESKLRAALVTYFPMLIAILSLAASLYSAHLYSRFLDILQWNTVRAEYMRSCKEIIDAYFQVKFRAGLIRSAARGRASASVPMPEQLEGANAVNRFAALGTYLANLRDEATRESYTHLSWELQKAIEQAATSPDAEIGQLFAKADGMFAALNDDCVKFAKTASQ